MSNVQHVTLPNECAAAKCHRPVQDARLCPGCVATLREHLALLAGSPAAARVRDDRPGPWRDQPRQPGPWRDGERGPAATEAEPDPAPWPREDADLLPFPDRGLLADVELTATRQDVAAPDTTRPAEIVEDGERRTKDRPELAPAITALPFRPGASQVLADARRQLCQLVCDVLERRYGATLGLDGRALLRGERLYRTKTRPPLHGRDVPLGRAHGPWPAEITPGKTPAEHAAWLGLGHAWDVAQLEYAGQAADDLARLVDRANAVIVRKDRVCLGHCGRCWDDHEAVVDVWADEDATTAACPRCAQEFDVQAYRERMLEHARDARVSAAHASQALSIWARVLRSKDAHGNVVDDNPAELTVKEIEGKAARGVIAYWRPTTAELDAARTAKAARPVTKYQLGELMDAVRAQHAADLMRAERRRKQGRRTVEPSGDAGVRRAAG